MKKYHILMADIVKSREKNSVGVMNDFKDIVFRIQELHCDKFLSPPTITLGDEFQCIVTSALDGVEVIFAFEEMLIKLDKSLKFRYILNFGPIDTAINPVIAYGMLGDGLTVARGLLGKYKTKKKRFVFNLRKAVLSKELGLAFKIFQSIVDEWKTKDYRIVNEFLIHEDYKKVAKNLNKDASLMWRRKKSLRLPEYQAIKELISLLLEDRACKK